MFSWAVKADILAKNPVACVDKPRTGSRSKVVITSGDHAKLLAKASPELSLVLRVLHGTGCRPGEACGITAENFDAALSVVTLTVHKCDRANKARVIPLSPEMVGLLEARRAKFGTGVLLRTVKGRPWNPHNIGLAMKRLRQRVGVKGVFPYGYRHTFATDALARGVPEAVVAGILGHASTSVLHSNYNHLTGQTRVLVEAVAKVR